MKIHKKLTFREVDSLDKYLKDIASDPDSDVLTREQELELFEQYEQTKSARIKKRIIQSNLRWVISVAKQFDFKKAQVSDLINEGNIGMIEAFGLFDYRLGNKFISFATPYISRNIKSYLSNTISDVVLPANRNRVKKLIGMAKMNLQKIGNFEPTNEQLVDEYNSIKEKVDPVIDSVYLNEMEVIGKGFISASATLSQDSDAFTLEGTFISSPNYLADNGITMVERKQEIVNSLVNILNEREAKVILLHFGIETGEEMTLEQVGSSLGYTRERIGQIKDTAISKLKNHKQLMFQLLGSSKERSVLGEGTDTNIGQNRIYENVG